MTVLFSNLFKIGIKGKWGVQSFFTKPGIKVGATEEKQQVYLCAGTHPNIYGYRFGAPIEVRDILRYSGPFTDEAAQREAKEAREQQSRCTVM